MPFLQKKRRLAFTVVAVYTVFSDHQLHVIIEVKRSKEATLAKETLVDQTLFVQTR